MSISVSGGPLRLGGQKGGIRFLGGSAAAWTPAALAPVFWLKASAITGKNDGDTLATWADSSGNGNNATAVGSPTYETNVLNGKPAARQVGGASWTLPNMAASFPSAATLFVLYTPENSGYSVVETGTPGDSFWRFGGNGDGYMGVFRSARISNYPTAMPATGNHLITVRSSAAGYQVWKNGVAQTAQAAGYAVGTAWKLGAGGGGGALVGNIYEVFGVAAAATAEQITAAHAYFTTEYGVPA